MANFLDETGVLKLWNKIKSYAAKQTDMNIAIVNISASGTTLTVTKADGTTKYVTEQLVKGQMIYCCSNSEDQIYCCATAVGSAFEGAEMAMGMPAAVGAISHVWLDQRRIRGQVIGDEEACGICGSGLIDALAVILEMGLLDHTGLLKQKQFVSVAYRKYLGEYAGQPCVCLANQVCVTQEDIRGLQLAKAAFAAGMRILLQDSHTSYEQRDHVILAGGFGSYLKKESAAAI